MSLKGSLSGYLPTPAFVMAKKSLKNLKAGTSAEVPAFSAFMFVLESGEGDALFTKMLEAMGLQRQDVRISNSVKDREALEAQIKNANPKILVALGEGATKILLGTDAIPTLRGKIHEHQGTKVVATFHPSFLLKNPPAKKDCWEDLQLAMKEIGWKK